MMCIFTILDIVNLEKVIFQDVDIQVQVRNVPELGRQRL